MDKVFLTIRKITIAPVMAVLLLFVVQVRLPGVFETTSAFFAAILFLGIFPVLAYPMQKYIPSYRCKGRDGQRRLAMIFAVAGYVLGVVVVFFSHATKDATVIYLEYLFSGVQVFVFNKAFHKKISGHACGITAPVSLFIYFGLYVYAAIGIMVAALVYIASLKTKRHTFAQLVGGSIVSVAAILLICCLFGCHAFRTIS